MAKVDRSVSEMGSHDDIEKRREARRSAAPSRSTSKVKAKEKAKAEEFIDNAIDEVIDWEDDLSTWPDEEKPVTETKTKRKARAPKGYTFSAEDIVRVRDTEGKSWANVAKMLDLPNPGAARKAYSELTGKSHTESVMTGKRARSGSGEAKKLMAPVWDINSDRTEIAKQLKGSIITVKRELYGYDEPEELYVAKVVKFHKDDPENVAVEFIEGRYRYDSKSDDWFLDSKISTGARRTVALAAIVEVRQ